MTVLVLLIGMIVQLTNGMASIIGRGQAHIDTDEQARALLDRMAIDFGAMVKRLDVDYYLKGRPVTLTQAGNDQIAFYTEVPGYFPAASPASGSTTAQSNVSLVAYRVNGTTMRLERLCKGLAWNGAATGSNIMSFLPVPLASPLPSPLASPLPAVMPTPAWPQAADATTQDLDYEELSPQIFRFEYYYVLKGQSATNNAAVLSLVPWYTNHLSVNGMQDVAGIGVLIAVIDPKSRVLVSKDQLAALATQMEDAPDPAGGTAFTNPGDIEAQWTKAVNSSILPRPAKAAIRIYTRCFYLNGVSP